MGSLTETLLQCSEMEMDDFRKPARLRELFFKPDGTPQDARYIDDIRRLEAQLKASFGMEDFDFLDYGSSALALRSNDKVFRLQFDPSKEAEEDHAFIPPAAEHFCAHLDAAGMVANHRYEVTDYLNTQSVTPADSLLTYIRLLDVGVIWRDAYSDNMGRDQNGDLKIFDIDSFIFPSGPEDIRRFTERAVDVHDMSRGKPGVISDSKNVLIVMDYDNDAYLDTRAQLMKSLRSIGIMDRDDFFEDTPLIRLRNRTMTVGGQTMSMAQLAEIVTESVEMGIPLPEPFKLQAPLERGR